LDAKALQTQGLKFAPATPINKARILSHGGGQRLIQKCAEKIQIIRDLPDHHIHNFAFVFNLDEVKPND
jgi:hypothetical protein